MIYQYKRTTSSVDPYLMHEYSLYLDILLKHHKA